MNGRSSSRVLLGVVMAGLLLASPARAGERIQGAFGLVLGARFDRFDAGASGMGRDALWVEFAPPAQMPVFKRFRALVSPIGYEIHGLLAEDRFPTVAECQEWAKGLFATVAEKYEGDEHGTRMLSWDDERRFRLEQGTHGRRIAVGCDADGALTMIYDDRALSERSAAEHEAWNRLTDDFEAGRYAAAVPRLTELAAQGHMHSEFMLAVAHRRGLGVERDDAKAERLYRQAAGKGMIEAQFNLGAFEMERGRLAAAHPWLLKAADRNVAVAQEALAQLHLRPGTLYDEAAAFGWFLKAAEGGRVESQYNTCHMYSAGDGVPRDEVQAWKWCDIAATSGHQKAADNREFIAQRMTPAQLQRARHESSQWLDAHRKP